MDQEEKETGMQTENCREEEEREEGEADREEYRKLCMERERELGRYELGFLTPNIPSFLRDVSE